MKTKKNRGAVPKFAMVTLGMLALFIMAVCMSTDVSALSITSVATVLAIPFAFTLPDSLQAKMTKEELDGIKALGDQISSYLQSNYDGKLEEKTMNDKIKAAWDTHMKSFGISAESYKSLQDTLREQGIEIAALKENGGRAEQPKSLYESVKEWVGSQEYKAQAASGAKAVLPMLHIKAATPMSRTATTIGAGAATPHMTPVPELFRMEIDRNIYEAPREQPFLFRLIAKGSTNANVIIWINRVNRQGGAAFIPEFGVKPLMSWDHVKETASPIKIAVGVKISTEMLNDAEYLAGEIDTILNGDIWEKIDENTMTFIDNHATAYQGTGLDAKIATPNEADAVRAGILQMRNAKCKPNVLIVSPTTKAMIDLTKNSTGNYMKQEIDALLKSVTIYETVEFTNEDDFILLDTDKIKGKFKGDVMVSSGWGVNKVADGEYRSDYEMNAITMLVEREIYMYMNSIDEVGILKDRFSVVKLALTKA